MGAVEWTTLDVKPRGSIIKIVSGDERRVITDFSQPVDVDTTKTWALEASRPGFRTLSMPLVFDDQAEKTFVVSLTEPSRAAPAAAPVAENPAPQEMPTEVALTKTDKGGDKAAQHAGTPKPELAKTEPAPSKPPIAAAPAVPAAAAAPAKAQGPVVA